MYVIVVACLGTNAIAVISDSWSLRPKFKVSLYLGCCCTPVHAATTTCSLQIIVTTTAMYIALVSTYKL